ncbi:MAG: CPBP family intramembrane glutamic endopeptidase [Syntrophomonadaceae bacterium]
MSSNKPRWGLMELVLVYLGILGAGILFGLYGDALLDYTVKVINIPDNELSYFVLSFIIQFLVTVALVILLARGRLHELGIRKASPSSYTRYGVTGGISLLIIITVAGYVIQQFAPDLGPQVYEQMLRSVKEGSGFITVFMIGAIFAPLSEELYYRGMMYPVFKGYLGPWGGAIVAGTIFGLSHWDLWRTIPLSIGGAILCYIYEKSGSIFVSALAHGIWNAVMSLIIYFSMVQSG